MTTTRMNEEFIFIIQEFIYSNKLIKWFNTLLRSSVDNIFVNYLNNIEYDGTLQSLIYHDEFWDTILIKSLNWFIYNAFQTYECKLIQKEDIRYIIPDYDNTINIYRNVWIYINNNWHDLFKGPLRQSTENEYSICPK